MSRTFDEWCRYALRLELTKGQTVLARVAFDGTQPSELPAELQDIAREMFGSLEDIPEVARERLVLSCGRGSGKSTLAAAASLKRMCEADLSPVGPGDIAAAIVIGVGKDGGEDTLNKARALAEQSRFASSITRNIIGGFHIKRGDGRLVRFQSIAASARGKAGRGKSIIQCIIDESEFVASSDPSKIVRDSDIIASVTPRMIRGAKLILASTPWPAESETHRLFRENWGRPQTALCAMATTVVMRDHDPHWVRKRELEYARDPMNAQREFDCIRGSAEGSFLEPETVDRAIDRTIIPRLAKACAGIDLAFKSDSSTIVITERQGASVAVVALDMDVPPPGRPLEPSVIGTKYAKRAAAFKASELVADAHYIESAREHANAQGVGVVAGPSVSGDKEASFIYLRDLFRSGLIRVPDDERLTMQLKSILVVHQSGGGLRIVLPRRQGFGHCDLVSALVNAVWMDKTKWGPLTAGVQDEKARMPKYQPRTLAASWATGSVFGR